MSTSSASSGKNRNQKINYTHLIVLDFEAQCLDGVPKPRPQEIVEWPLVVVDIESRAVVDEFHTFVKPTAHPNVFPFTTQLTGVTQADVDGGVEIDEAMSLADAFIAKYNDDEMRALVVTCGHWDLRTALFDECRFKRFAVPRSLKQWCNVKLIFQQHYKLPKPLGMDGMLQHLKMELIGRHHSGIDDARNIARLVIRLLEDGAELVANGHSA
jgi:inhibitor of KinA sporulation pathway (predicted exonuclease)